MLLLPSLISLRHPTDHELSPEDIFSSSLGAIFTDDLQNQHGTDPSTTILYTPSNPRYASPIELHAADVDGEEQRRKFAHYLWNAGVLMGELVGGRAGAGAYGRRNNEGDSGRWGEGEWWLSREEEAAWSVKGERVLELGAGVGLGGIMSALAGAEEVAITDYPAPPILDTLKKNITKNLPAALQPRVSVEPHQWGDFSNPFASTNAHRYTRVLAADCLWMPYEHHNLALSMVHFLSPSPEARVYVIAGFHTGRAKMAPFIEEVVPEVGLAVEDVFEMDAEGRRREWVKERDGGREDIGGRKKWLMVARLKRKVEGPSS
ncbi:hypothetical protein CC80DRAFT_282480 [Byssothecium circinans]|uniref:Nicotinamide N-methyltransferase n=1 Tax=Byssothecium circinans TaxID=147558 RepID=A0A6A5T9Q4_9PLEO|nr:hypothetical protein CC80DRAFT_282480 [Byssothecium circinans]